jgi:hypothetical protein
MAAKIESLLSSALEGALDLEVAVLAVAAVSPK